MTSKEITAIKVVVEYDHCQEQPAYARYEVHPEEQFEHAFCNYVIPVYPMHLFVVTRKKTGGPQIINKVEILRTE